MLLYNKERKKVNVDNILGGQRIIEARTFSNITLDDVADEIGVAKSTIQRYENQKLCPYTNFASIMRFPDNLIRFKQSEVTNLFSPLKTKTTKEKEAKKSEKI